MLYDVSVKIGYDYPDRADAGRHLLRLLPADIPGVQRVIAANISFSPDPAERNDHRDFFGNWCTEIAYQGSVSDATFSMYARVERIAPDPLFDVSTQMRELPGEILSINSLAPHSPAHYSGPSQLVQPVATITEWASEVTGHAQTAFGKADGLCKAIHREMRFDPEATTIDTPFVDAFTARHGVCQDFTHIAIAGLRGIGIPAGYVSGVLQTIPPEGQERLEGADAMHAWVRAWCGSDMGWVEFDPTNAMLAGENHLVIAYGRDYFDVSPVKGALRSSGSHSTSQKVDVVEAEANS
jgi:transglutaminase-like putative cysteine protease